MTTLLIEFFEREYLPARLALGRHPDYVESFRTAIGWLGETVGRDARLSDLTRKKLRAMMRRLAARGMGRSRIRQLRTRISSLWLHAYHIGLIDQWEPAPPVPKVKRRPSFVREPGPEGTLTRFYVEEYRPKLIDLMTDQTVRNYDAAVEALHRFYGRHLQLQEIDETLLNQFLDGVRADVAPRTLYAYRGCIEQIVRAWDAERFPLVTRRVEPLPEPAEGTVRWFFEEYYRPQRMLDCTDRSVVETRRALRSLREHYGRDLALDEQTDALAAEHFGWLRERGIRPPTINSSYRAPWFAVWRFAHELGRVEHGPNAPKLREDLDDPDAWTVDEAARILQAAAEFELPGRATSIDGVPAGLWWRAILLVGWWTGQRRGALLKLRRADVDLATRCVEFPASITKTGRGRRYRLGADAVEAVSAIWQPERELLFPWPFTMKGLSLHFALIVEAAGVPASKRRTLTLFHKWRRTVATHVAARGGLSAAVDILDHSSPRVTERYLDRTMLPGRDASRYLPPLAPAGEPDAGGDELPDLASAKDLLASGHVRAAGMVARAALERFLRELCRQYGCRCTGRGLLDRAKSLHGRKALTDEQLHHVHQLIHTGNRAAHGEPVESDCVAQMVEAVGRLVSGSDR